jgi:hypothetical protein
MKGRPRFHRLKQLGMASAPLLLLIACLAIFNLASGLLPSAAPEESSPSPTSLPDSSPVRASPTSPTLAAPTIGVTLSPSATPTAIPTATPIPIPTLPADATIQLLGPPDESASGRGNSISFYWIWPHALPDDAYFSVLIITDEQTFNVESLFAPNLGDTYFSQVNLGQLATNSSALQWQVNLHTPLMTTPLLESDRRTLRLLP